MTISCRARCCCWKKKYGISTSAILSLNIRSFSAPNFQAVDTTGPCLPSPASWPCSTSSSGPPSCTFISPPPAASLPERSTSPSSRCPVGEEGGEGETQEPPEPPAQPQWPGREREDQSPPRRSTDRWALTSWPWHRYQAGAPTGGARGRRKAGQASPQAGAANRASSGRPRWSWLTAPSTHSIRWRTRTCSGRKLPSPSSPASSYCSATSCVGQGCSPTLRRGLTARVFTSASCLYSRWASAASVPRTPIFGLASSTSSSVSLCSPPAPTFCRRTSSGGWDGTEFSNFDIGRY